MTRVRGPLADIVRAVPALAAAAAIAAVPALVLPVVAGPALGTAAQAATRTADPVRVQVVSTSPTTPAITTTNSPYSVTLVLTNETHQSIPKVTITGLRGDPLTTESSLTAAFARSTPSASANPITAEQPATTSLPADGQSTVTFTTTTSTVPSTGICLCVTGGVYPLYLSAHSGSADGDTLGSVTTWLPSFDHQPQRTRVAWVWPLLDRPHRLVSSTTFTDDDLTEELADGGRLSDALAAAELVAQHARATPLTLLVDPELLSEVEVMATGNYRVQAGTGTVPGAGGAAATAWLDRFRQLLQDHPQISVQLTPYADPDIQTLSERGLSWAAGLPSTMATQVSSALAGRPMRSTLSWPAASRISTRTLSTLAADGVQQVLLNSTAVTPQDGAGNTAPAGLARLSAGRHSVTAALTSTAIENAVAAVLSGPGSADATSAAGTAAAPSGAAALPQLAAQLAMGAVEQPQGTRTLVLTAPRYVDADPQVALRAIEATSSSTFSAPASLSTATAAARLPASGSALVAPAAGATGLPNAVADDAAYVAGQLPAIASMLDQPTSTGTSTASGTAAASSSSNTVPATVPATASRTSSQSAAAGQSVVPGRPPSTSPSASSSDGPSASSSGSPSDSPSVSPTGSTPAGQSASASGAGLHDALQEGLQRTESSYWLIDAQLGGQFAAKLTRQVDGVLNAVRIISPSSGIYTLASGNSPLPVTVENDLAYPARIRVSISTVNDLPGFRVSRDIGTQTIEPNSKQTLHLPTVLQRSGRIPITAQLLTPDHRDLGAAIALSVHSTALGLVGIVITVVAGGILALALLIRIVRRLLGHQRRRPTAPRTGGAS